MTRKKPSKLVAQNTHSNTKVIAYNELTAERIEWVLDNMPDIQFVQHMTGNLYKVCMGKNKFYYTSELGAKNAELAFEQAVEKRIQDESEMGA